MSTFDGFVKEFPTIRIDYFRADIARPKPAACFLSHVHSDHLLGLESLKMPFVYCSATTRRILLRMEKYPHRMNFQKGILESRKQHWRHLRTLLRPLPLQTPTTIELSPKLTIQVTLFDAHHCPGAVMFLIAGDGKAVLYTGDVRAEVWWVNSVIQTPALLPYAVGLKRLDCIYLDTTFASGEKKYKQFPTKAEGLRELMTKILPYAKGTKFYFRAWTLGYEQVWITLANLLQCKVHVDPYQLRLFEVTNEDNNSGFNMFESPALVGFKIGNDYQDGCLTTETEAQVHSCEPGMPCHASLVEAGVVWITPIISRLPDGTELREVGAGGGGGDLYQKSELELTDDLTSQALELVSTELISHSAGFKAFREAIARARNTGALKLPLEGLGLDNDTEISLKEFVSLISEKKQLSALHAPDEQDTRRKCDQVITFPYSRHSSLGELRHLVQSLRPKDLYACTVELPTWSEKASMRALFGDLCSEQIFDHDKMVRQEFEVFKQQQSAQRLKRKREDFSPERSSPQIQQSASFHSARSLPETSWISNPMKGQHKMATQVSCPVVAPAISMTPRTALQQRSALPASAASNLTPDRRLPQQELTGEETQSESDATDNDMEARATAIREEFEKFSRGTKVIVIGDDSSDEDKEEKDLKDSQLSLTTSAFASQNLDTTESLHDAVEIRPAQAESAAQPSESKVDSRREAYRLARQCMRSSDSSGWNDLNLRSVGAKGHSATEAEL